LSLSSPSSRSGSWIARWGRASSGPSSGGEQQDVVKLSAGTIATLTAMVLGLLVSSATGSFDTTNTAIVQGGTKIIDLDRALAAYGPETHPRARAIDAQPRGQHRKSLAGAQARRVDPDRHRALQRHGARPLWTALQHLGR
jgi:hypothetical protein